VQGRRRRVAWAGVLAQSWCVVNLRDELKRQSDAALEWFELCAASFYQRQT